ncbi:MAG: DUF695 domain-containing protein [Marmoricola sp.]
MGFFRRNQAGPAPTDPQITALWQWWTDQGRMLAEQSIESSIAPEEFSSAMTEHVRAVGELGWELAPGAAAEHVLVVTAEGDPERRALARRVVLAAPLPDQTWTYSDSRPPHPEPESVVLSADGSPEMDLARVQVSARVNAGRFDVQVHHPLFADLPERNRTQLAFLALDAALGELETELWLGEVVAIEFSPLDGFGLTALRSVVADLKRTQLDADGNPRWVMMTGETRDGALRATVRSPLHPLTAPHLDTYVSVTLPYADRSPDGLPEGASLEALEALAQRLQREIGQSGQVVAHLSNAGVRTIHLYVDSAASLVPTVKDVARSWGEGKASVHEMHDPGWQAVTHLRG